MKIFVQNIPHRLCACQAVVRERRLEQSEAISNYWL